MKTKRRIKSPKETNVHSDCPRIFCVKRKHERVQLNENHPLAESTGLIKDVDI